MNADLSLLVSNTLLQGLPLLVQLKYLLWQLTCGQRCLVQLSGTGLAVVLQLPQHMQQGSQLNLHPPKQPLTDLSTAFVRDITV